MIQFKGVLVNGFTISPFLKPCMYIWDILSMCCDKLEKENSIKPASSIPAAAGVVGRLRSWNMPGGQMAH